MHRSSDYCPSGALWSGLALWSTLLAIAGCGWSTTSKDAGKTAPAKVAHPVNEVDLNTIKLTAEAEKHLGIETSPVVARRVNRVRGYGGEIMLPPGSSTIVSAPVNGTLQAPSEKGVPQPGAKVKRQQPVFLLLPLLSPERAVLTPAERIRFAEAKNALVTSRIDAAGQVQQSQAQVDAAKIALDRAERLLRDQAGTVRAVDDAKAQLEIANKGLEAALSRQKVLEEIRLDEDAGELLPLTLESPQDGILRAEHATAGQVVAAGAPLFEVMDCDPVWVRVPVYVGEAAEILADRPARVASLADRSAAQARAAQPIAAPPTATALASTVDFYYELPNSSGELRPGARVNAALPVAVEDEARLVPWSAVVHDINGGTWVYEQTAPQTFVRRRVQIRFVDGDQAVLDQGPGAGAALVTTGAMELFGTEFGFGK
ncbi:MAG TPA: efflux RND transporter periplasmic adaptor subunit [Pirellulales bacterium]|nr:efflux RND transporter periplasmic adaptor subunit [Pirellulales bacterium]